MALLGSPAAVAQPEHEGHADPNQSHRLHALLTEYFQTSRTQERSALARKIEDATGGDVAEVAEALTRLQVWPMTSGPFGNFSIPGDPAPVLIGTYQLPDAYDFRRAHPVIVCMPGEAYMTGAVVHDALRLLGAVAQEAVLLCPHIPEMGSFHQTEMTPTLFRALLRHLRKRIHCDTHRVYLFGIGSGADAAWMTAINHPDLFAGVIALSGYPELPFPEASYRLLLQNLSHTPVLSVWASADDADVASRRYAVAAHNRLIAAASEEASLPIRSLEIKRPVSTEKESEPSSAYPLPVSELPADAIHDLLTRRRTIPHEFTHWFRYPDFGRTAWIEQIDFNGRVWTDPQISIQASPDVDRIAYITDVLKGKLAYMGARIEGRAIDIRTRRCSRIELALPPGLMDFGGGVTVRINGLRRRADGLEPSVPTLLESAYDDWEFQHPAAARLRFSVRSDAGSE